MAAGSLSATCGGHGRREWWRRAAGPWDPVEKMAQMYMHSRSGARRLRADPSCNLSLLQLILVPCLLFRAAGAGTSGPPLKRAGRLPRAGVLHDESTVATGPWAVVERVPHYAECLGTSGEPLLE